MTADPFRVLIVDDEADARQGLKSVLETEYLISEADSGEQALELLGETWFDVVMIDYSMTGMNGLELLRAIKEHDPAQPGPGDPALGNIQCIMVTAYGNEEIAVDAMKGGAFDYLVKPYQIVAIRKVVQRAVEFIAIDRENRRLRHELRSARFEELVGSSGPMEQLFELIRRVAATDVTVMIRGESGTGKELVAHALHRHGARREQPFVAVNCAAIPKDLIESELFGYRKGAFTGAVADQQGKFEQAHKGTLLLDEVGDMALETQAKLLRVLESRSVTRLGEGQPLPVNVRILASTHKDLTAGIGAGWFREDLYYRLRVVEIGVPPLRHRREDIPLLAHHFLQKFAKRHKRPLPRISAQTVGLLLEQSWPGNVRELANVLESALVLSPPGELDEALIDAQLRAHPAARDGADPLPQPDAAAGPAAHQGDFIARRKRLVASFERQEIEQALAASGGNVSAAARQLGLTRQFLQQKMKALQIGRPS